MDARTFIYALMQSAPNPLVKLLDREHAKDEARALAEETDRERDRAAKFAFIRQLTGRTTTTDKEN